MMQKHAYPDTRVLVAFLITILSVAIVSCAPTDENTPDMDYRTGTDGISVNFMSGSPPAKVYEKSPLYLVAEVRNQGAFDNNPTSLGHVTLHGFDVTAMPFQGAENNNYVKVPLPAVQGKGAYLNEGGYDTVTFEIDDNALRVPYGDKYEPTLMLSTCYVYRTIATPTVCIIPDPQLLLKNKVCEPRTITMKSQGGPVAVTKVEEEIMRESVNFVITIENVGGGNVISRSSLADCPFNLDRYEKLNTVDVTASMRTAKLLSCVPDKSVRLVDGKGTIFCKFALKETAPYTTPLNIQLDYAYNTNTKRTLEIAKIPGTSSYADDSVSESNGYISSGTTGGSESCQCYGSDPCVCLYYSGSNYVCSQESIIVDSDGEDSYGTYADVAVSVVGSDESVKSCGIDGKTVACGSSTTIRVHEYDMVTVAGYGADGQLVASESLCEFQFN
ncbi:hypothetical protein JXB31_02630 [Candidatus Woesearchaeota archaeon]|nr:hypothetical protein [Candidatus Woesearchaeota archaeon]